MKAQKNAPSKIQFTEEQKQELKNLYGEWVPFDKLKVNLEKWIHVISNPLQREIMTLLDISIEEANTLSFEQLSNECKISMKNAADFSYIERARLEFAQVTINEENNENEKTKDAINITKKLYEKALKNRPTEENKAIAKYALWVINLKHGNRKLAEENFTELSTTQSSNELIQIIKAKAVYNLCMMNIQHKNPYKAIDAIKKIINIESEEKEVVNIVDKLLFDIFSKTDHNSINHINNHVLWIQ